MNARVKIKIKFLLETMILYIEKQALPYSQTQNIINKFKNATLIHIDNYKNIFDKNIWNHKLEKSIIIAKLNSSSVWKTPPWYWHTDNSYFFKTSINCIFDCSYCFLKWAFKNSMMLFFINYEDIKKEIKNTIIASFPYVRERIQDRVIKNNHLWFYSSDYSDILSMNDLSNFSQEFIPFFEKFENTMMEIRTKSDNITPLLNLWFIPKNTEIAFSLNPQELIEKYESKTPNLEKRIKAVNTLLDKWFKVWLRFLPLLPVQNYKNIYKDFIEQIKTNINLQKIHSTFASWLLYTKKDYSTILKKYPDLDILYMLQKEDDDFYRESRKVRNDFYKMFKELDENCMICLDD